MPSPPKSTQHTYPPPLEAQAAFRALMLQPQPPVSPLPRLESFGAVAPIAPTITDDTGSWSISKRERDQQTWSSTLTKDAFLPTAGWTAAATGLTGPHTMNLSGQGIRSIEWCPGIGPGGAGRYLIIGGPANGGPLEKEAFGEKFSIYSWDGNVNTTPTRLITDLRPYTVRPEGVDMITVGGQSRVMFVEDRYLAQGYGARNAIHWPASILSSEMAIP